MDPLGLAYAKPYYTISNLYKDRMEIDTVASILSEKERREVKEHGMKT